MRTLLQSGVLVEVEATDTGYTLRLTHPDRVVEWDVSELEGEALMLALMAEHAR